MPILDPVGTPIMILYVGSHDTITTYDSLATDSRQFFRMYDRFNAIMFVGYLKSMHRCFEKITVIVDRATIFKQNIEQYLFRKSIAKI